MWLDPEAIQKLNRDLKKVSDKLDKAAKEAPTWVDRELRYYGNLMRITILKSMRSTPKSTKAYYRGEGRWHHSSLPYNPPAIDFGELLSSVMFDAGNMELTIGSKAKKAPHGLWMELGTKGLAGMGYIVEPRPWLAPGVQAHIDDLRKDIGEITVEMIGKTFENWERY